MANINQPQSGVYTPLPSSGSITYDDFLKSNPRIGLMKIQSFAGYGALPLEGISIEVSKTFKDGKKIFFSGLTDNSGIIDSIMLPAPKSSLSTEPSTAPQYAEYDIFASKRGMIPKSYLNVPVFDGVKSIQNITLSPM